MNIELLKKVQAHILEEPRRLDMDFGIKPSAAVPCGTVGCIAGWAAILSGRIDPKLDKRYQEGNEMLWWGQIPNIAEDALDLEKSETLFYHYHWPAPFGQQYVEAVDAQGRAQVTAARIQHLIDKGE